MYSKLLHQGSVRLSIVNWRYQDNLVEVQIQQNFCNTKKKLDWSNWPYIHYQNHYHNQALLDSELIFKSLHTMIQPVNFKLLIIGATGKLTNEKFSSPKLTCKAL